MVIFNMFLHLKLQLRLPQQVQLRAHLPFLLKKSLMLHWYTWEGGAQYEYTKNSWLLIVQKRFPNDVLVRQTWQCRRLFLALFWKGHLLKENFTSSSNQFRLLTSWNSLQFFLWTSTIDSDSFPTKVWWWRPTRSSSNRMRTEMGWDSAGTCGHPADLKPPGSWSRSHASSPPSKRGLTCHHYNMNQ